MDPIAILDQFRQYMLDSHSKLKEEYPEIYPLSENIIISEMVALAPLSFTNRVKSSFLTLGVLALAENEALKGKPDLEFILGLQDQMQRMQELDGNSENPNPEA